MATEIDEPRPTAARAGGANMPATGHIWEGFDRVAVDLADVVGTPGMPHPLELNERVSREFGGRTFQVAAVAHPFLFGDFSERMYGPAHRMAGAFITRFDAALPDAQLRPSDVRVIVAKDSATGTHVVVQQMIRGAEVVGARFQLHVGHDRQLFGLTGRPVGDLHRRDPGDPPLTSESDAIAAMRTHLELPREVPIQVERVVFPVSGTGIWAFRGCFTLSDPVVDVRVYVRADDLSLLLSHNVVSAALYGEANVFPVNPRRTPEVKLVRLENIGPVPPDRLTGTVVEVLPGVGAALTQALRDCRLRATDDGFDEVNAFYHVSSALRYFEGIMSRSTFDATPFAPLRAVVHHPGSPNNSYYQPSTGQLLFGDFEAGPAARCADIIYHEVAHAVSDKICRLGRGVSVGSRPTPARGMNEGYSDYFAASALDNPVIGDFVADSDDGLRNLAKGELRFKRRYTGTAHDTGVVWGAFLWSLRSALGAGIVDILAAESLYFLGRNATFEEGLGAVLQADARLFPLDNVQGRHAELIKHEFSRRRPR